MDLNSLHIENFSYENIEKGYSISDILFIIYSENPEEIDQQRQNFFALFGIYIKIVLILKILKVKTMDILKDVNLDLIDIIVIKLLNLIKILEKYLFKSNF